MPIHDWTRVKAAIFHDFHHGWITELARALNRRCLPPDYYALIERQPVGFGPDVVTQQVPPQPDTQDSPNPIFIYDNKGFVLGPPKLTPTAESDLAYYRRKQSTITVRHVSGDEIVAMIEIVSPGNKAGSNALRAFVEKAAELLDKHVHLLILDLLPPGRRDPQGIHGAIWEECTGQEYVAPADKRLTLVSYECGLAVRAYVVHVAVGDALPDMPLYLEPDKAVPVPLEATYQGAFAAVPRRWQRVVEAPPL